MNLLRLFVYVFIMIFGMGLFSIMQEAVIDLDTSAWAFVGHDFIIVLLPVMPLVFLVIFLTVPAYFIIDDLGGLGR